MCRAEGIVPVCTLCHHFLMMRNAFCLQCTHYTPKILSPKSFLCCELHNHRHRHGNHLEMLLRLCHFVFHCDVLFTLSISTFPRSFSLFRSVPIDFLPFRVIFSSIFLPFGLRDTEQCTASTELSTSATARNATS